jgi:hypothetical protein
MSTTQDDPRRRLFDLHYREVNQDEDENGNKLAAWEVKLAAIIDEWDALL